MKIHLIIIGLLTSLYCGQHAHAQSNATKPARLATASFKHKKYKKNLQLQARLYYGFLASHHTELKVLEGHVPAFELSLVYKTFGKNEWQKQHNYPYINYNILYSPLTGHEHLGKVYAVYPSMAIPLHQNYNRYITFNIGLGLGYITKHFHPTENYKNLAIGSHFNIFINLMFDYKYHVNTLTDLSVGLGLVHLSNGGMASPNYGLNFPMASLGISKKISRENRRLYPRRPQIPLFGYKDNKIYIYNLHAAYATKDMGNIIGEQYQVFSGSLSILKRLDKVNAVGLSLDGMYDEYSKDYLTRKLDTTELSFNQVFRLGISPTYEVRFSKLIASMGVGYYISGEKSTNTEFYETVALKYIAYKNLYAIVNLRAHGARAAYLGFGLGYRLEWDFGEIKTP